VEGVVAKKTIACIVSQDLKNKSKNEAYMLTRKK
ncbi:uncharacterized protein METZ01_LOCUS190392, partial [marine metagenome]